jgi:hypothetical protein
MVKSVAENGMEVVIRGLVMVIQSRWRWDFGLVIRDSEQQYLGAKAQVKFRV